MAQTVKGSSEPVKFSETEIFQNKQALVRLHTEFIDRLDELYPPKIAESMKQGGRRILFDLNRKYS